MRHQRTIRIVMLMISVAWTSVALTWAQNPQWRTNRQARTVVNRLITNTSYFQREVQRNRYPWDTATTSEERLTDMVGAFSNALSTLQTSLNTGNDPMDEVSGVLARASR